MITEQQINNIYNLSKEDQKIILDICIESLGLVDIDMAKEALGLSRSRIYQLMNNNNTYEIGRHKFICINMLK